jgi:hypothetical protein
MLHPLTAGGGLDTKPGAHGEEAAASRVRINLPHVPLERRMIAAKMLARMLVNLELASVENDDGE